MELHGYRFYVTSNKGFAPVFTWFPADGSMPQAGAIHLPRYPTNKFAQAMEWPIPGTGIVLWLQLMLDETLLKEGEASRLQPPQRYHAVIRQGDMRKVLNPGERLVLPQGELELTELRMWMGYSVFYDWTIPWMLAASTLAVLSLGWHFWRKFTAKPWDMTEVNSRLCGVIVAPMYELKLLWIALVIYVITGCIAIFAVALTSARNGRFWDCWFQP